MGTLKLMSIGNYGLHVMQFPSGKWGYVGTIPLELTEIKHSKNGLPYHRSKTFETRQSAIEYFEEKRHLFN